MSIRNGVQLITYADRLGDGNIESLNGLLNGKLSGLFTGVHILPFYYPYDGEDAGFDPIDHTIVDERLGDWNHIKSIGESKILWPTSSSITCRHKALSLKTC